MKPKNPLDTGSEAEKHHLIANSLCLDFANTLYGHRGTPIHEYLYGYRDVVIWSLKAGIVDERQAQGLLYKAEKQPTAAASAFRRAIHLREIIFSVFESFALDRSPSREDLEFLNNARREALAHSTIRPHDHGFVLDWDKPLSFDRVLWVIAIDAGKLLTSSQLPLVRECSGDTCDWLFVDTSRNHLRRWCQMRVCGNRAKVRRYFRRKQAAHSTS